MNPVIFPLIYLIIILMIVDNIDGAPKQQILSVAFPILVAFGIMLSCGVYAWTTVSDREDKLRYLLNFAGMRSSSYYFGLLLADFIIYVIPQILLGIMVFIL